MGHARERVAGGRVDAREQLLEGSARGSRWLRLQIDVDRSLTQHRAALEIDDEQPAEQRAGERRAIGEHLGKTPLCGTEHGHEAGVVEERELASGVRALRPPSLSQHRREGRAELRPGRGAWAAAAEGGQGARGLDVEERQARADHLLGTRLLHERVGDEGEALVEALEAGGEGEERSRSRRARAPAVPAAGRAALTGPARREPEAEEQGEREDPHGSYCSVPRTPSHAMNETLRDLPILVTGATGLVGGALCERLLGGGARVTALVRRRARAGDLEAKGARLVEGDLGDEDALVEASAGQALVFHSAARSGDAGDVAGYLEDNLEGTRRLFEACARAGVSRFVHLSTISAYGFSPPPEVTEKTPIEPFVGHYPYAVSKVRAERLLGELSSVSDTELVIARVGSVYGPGSAHWTLRPARLLSQGPVGMLLVDGGQGLHNHVYLDNLVDALVLLGQHPDAAGETCNVTDGATSYRAFFGAYAARMAEGRARTRSVSKAQALALAFVVEQAAALARKPPLITRIAVRLLCRKSVISSEKLRALGWTPRVSLDEGMDACARWLHEQGVL